MKGRKEGRKEGRKAGHFKYILLIEPEVPIAVHISDDSIHHHVDMSLPIRRKH